MVDDASVFGTSDRYPLFGKVHCIGTEPKLLECLHSGIGGHECGRDQDPVPDIAISCYGTNLPEKITLHQTCSH